MTLSVIRIQYAGPSEQFAWVLPIAGAPADVAVSSNIAFDNLRNASDPQYFVNTTVEGQCKDSGFGNVGFPSGGVAMGASPPATAADDGVGVVAQGAVGPYDWHVISVNPQLPDPADTAVARARSRRPTSRRCRRSRSGRRRLCSVSLVHAGAATSTSGAWLLAVAVALLGGRVRRRR
jgi:MYXO-CTERM domain-containing protein